MKKILIISSVPTHPTNAGNRVRILRMAQMLEEKGHNVYFAYIASHEMYYQPMLAFWGSRLLYLPPVQPSKHLIARLFRSVKNAFGLEQLIRQYWHRGKYTIDEKYNRRIDTFLQERCVPMLFDAVIVEYVNMSRSLLNFPSGTLKIMDTHDVFSNRDQLFTGTNRTFSITVAEEAKGLNRADVVIAIQPEEKAFFEQITTKKVLVIGHTVDIISSLSLPNTPRKKLLFLASRHEANVVGIQYFIHSILPLLTQSVPDVQVLIGGKIGEKIPDSAHYRKLGELPTLEAIYLETDVVINPVLAGTGLKIKNIEAMGYGKPVVTTSVGAEGLESGTGNAFLVGDTPELFAAHVQRLLTDDDFYAQVSQEAWRFAATYNQQVSFQLDQLLSDQVPHPYPLQ